LHLVFVTSLFGQLISVDFNLVQLLKEVLDIKDVVVRIEVICNDLNVDDVTVLADMFILKFSDNLIC